MKNHAFTRRLAATLLASGLLSVSLGAAGAAPAADPRLDLVSALMATGPHPSLGDQAQIFGRLVGAWDVDYADISKDGTVTRHTGKLIVGWVMDGRAIQDLWIVDPSGSRPEREVYADLRYFDAKTKTWSATFIDPEHGSVVRFTAGAADGDRIVLNTQDIGGSDTRWSFNDIGPGSFVFRDEVSSDAGKTWRLRGEDHMTRRSASPAN
jgi:hypothetical protein